MKKLLWLLIILPNLLFGQYDNIDSLDRFISKQVIDYGIPGFAIGIIRDNKIVLRKGYGTTSNVDSLPVTAQTIFPILSCTKAFTAAAIGILVDEGKLQWNDKVIKYLPDFKLSDPWITKELTIADILSHRSGLETFEGDLLWYGTSYTRKEIVRRIRYSPIRNNFRVDYGYQNIMYLVAGLIVEKITGQTWDHFINEKFFTPLSMNSSSTSITEMMKNNNYAQPHLKNTPIPVMNMDNIAPVGGINSNIDDMLHWLQVWINKGHYNDRQLFSENTYKTITTAKVMLSNNSDESYGFGWNIGLEAGKKVLSHGGGMPGYKSFITVIPEDSIGIVILTNKITYLNEELTGVIINYLTTHTMNWQEADNNMYGKNFHFSWDEEEGDTAYKQHSSIPNFSTYEGVYEDRGYGKATISKKNGKAVLELLPSKKQFTGDLYYLNKDTLKIVFNDKFVPAGEVIFRTDKNRNPIAFKLNINSSDFLFKYLDFKKSK
ncbi:MAG TPA: serine hydrolase [Puia sp.]|nr:serine hydrolase [Puia sp.]